VSVCECVNVSGECVCCVNVSVHMYVNGERVYVSASVCECVRCGCEYVCVCGVCDCVCDCVCGVHVSVCLCVCVNLCVICVCKCGGVYSSMCGCVW